MSKRIRFFIGHLGLSFSIASVVSLWLFLVWYQWPLAQAVGTMNLYWMMLAIDVIIGPILGFVVYKEHKKSLKFDLAVIILLQLSALVYGVYSLSQSRPSWIVYHNAQFEVVGKHEQYTENAKAVPEQYLQVSWLRPEYVAIDEKKDEGKYQLDEFAQQFGFSIAQNPEHYVAIEQAKARIQQKAQPLSILEQYNDVDKVNKIRQRYPEATAFLPLKASHQDMTVLVNKESGEIIKIINLRPW